MKYATRNFNPATNWVTAGLLTLVVTSFGIFVEIHAAEPEITFADVSTDVRTSISTHAVKLLTVCEDGAEDAIKNKMDENKIKMMLF